MHFPSCNLHFASLFSFSFSFERMVYKFDIFIVMRETEGRGERERECVRVCGGLFFCASLCFSFLFSFLPFLNSNIR